MKTRSDTVFTSRAIFVRDELLPAGPEAAARAFGDLGRFFRILRVTREKHRAAGGPTPPFFASVPDDCLDGFIRENAIEWYASWYIGKAPDIGFRGVLPCNSAGEILPALRRIARAEASSSVIVDRERLDQFVRALRRHRARIVLTNGVFDLLHVGHLKLLRDARALGDALIVAINSDDSTRSIKGAGRPVIPQFARAQLLAGLRSVDACFIFTEADPMNLLKTVKPEILVKGNEYPVNRIVGARLVSGYGGKVVRLPMVEGWSTTSTIRAVSSGRTDAAGPAHPLP